MIVPDPSVTQDYQIFFNGLMIGPGTPYSTTLMKGFLDLGGVRNTYVARPAKTGGYVQPHYAEAAVLDIAFQLVATTSTTFAAAVAALQAATYAQQTALPLTFKLPGRPPLAIGVQCLNRAIPVDQAFSFGIAQAAALQFFAADPRQYGAGSTLTTTLRQAGAGAVYPLVYPLNYGTAPSGGSLAFTNTGSTNTEPQFTVHGALSAGFQLTWVETGQHLTYSFPVGSDLVLDCGSGTAMTQGQDRTSYLTSRDWFSIPAGATATFAFAALGGETYSTNPGVSLTCLAAPAYI